MGRVFLICSCLLVSGVARAQDWIPTDVGSVGLAGSASNSAGVWTILGSGNDIWGGNDAFQFVHQTTSATGFVIARVTNLQAANPFAKAGVMVRASLANNAATAILDLKPDGGIEFMARLCGQCATTFLGGANIVFPAFLSLTLDGSTFTAAVFKNDPGDGSTIGTVEVPMTAPLAGFAVTSHDASHTTTAVFDNPAR
jgi:hypothetical protein